MINVGHWALRRRLQALLSAPDVVLEEGGAGVGMFEKECVKVASDAGGNRTAGLVITMGHGEGWEQADSVDGVRTAVRDRL